MNPRIVVRATSKGGSKHNVIGTVKDGQPALFTSREQALEELARRGWTINPESH